MTVYCISFEKSDITSIKISKKDVPTDAYEIVEGSYKNNVNKGTASVVIRGTSEEYGGEKTVTFKIVQKKLFW